MTFHRTTYDTLGNTLSVDDGTTVVEYVYDVNANILLERLGDESVSYAYNADGSKRFIGYEGMHYQLQRDENGNLTQIRRGLESYGFQYDPLKNQTALGNLILGNTLIDPLTHRLLRYGEWEFTYDTLGQLIEKTSPESRTTYTYDIEGYLIGYTCHSREGGQSALAVNPSPVLELRFTYDPLGRRITKHYKETAVIPKTDENLSVIPYSDTESISLVPNVFVGNVEHI